MSLLTLNFLLSRLVLSVPTLSKFHKSNDSPKLWRNALSDEVYKDHYEFLQPEVTEHNGQGLDAGSDPNLHYSKSADLNAIQGGRMVLNASEVANQQLNPSESRNSVAPDSSAQLTSESNTPLTPPTSTKSSICVEFCAQGEDETAVPGAPTKRPRKGFSSLVSLWNPSLVPVTPVLEMYHIIDTEAFSHPRHLITRSGGSSSMLLKITQNLDVEKIAIDKVRLVVLFKMQISMSHTILLGTSHDIPALSREWFNQYVKTFIGLEAVFRSAFNGLVTTSDVVVLKQIGLLRCYYVNLILIAAFFADIEAEYDLAESEGRHHLDPRRPILGIGILHDLAANASLYNDFSNKAAEVSETIDGLLNVLASQLSESSPTAFRQLSAELRSMCASTSEMAGRWKIRLDTYVKYGELHRAVQGSASVWVLSLLAAIFLPLNLATGILSMSSRFVELGGILYDFVGVAILLATLVIVLVAVLVGGIALKRLLSRTVRTRFSSASSIVLTTGSNALLSWVLLLASFLVGMIKDINLGWLTLGYGLAAFVGLHMLLLMLFGLFIASQKLFNSSSKGSNRKSKSSVEPSQRAPAAQTTGIAHSSSAESKV